MRNGRVVECGTPQELYYRPRRLFTAQFIGRAEIVPCTVARRDGGTALLETPLGPILSECGAADAAGRASLMIRPEHLSIVSADAHLPNTVPGTVVSAVFLGRLFEYEIALGARRLKLQTLSTQPHAPGARVALHAPPERCVLIAETDDPH
jgi:iron(III) transport system ATP-binding protein